MILKLLFAVGGVWILQLAFGYFQIKNFNEHYKRLMQLGRVVVGRKKGRITPGAVVMFAIDEDDKIIKGEKMKGFSVLARMKTINSVKGLDVFTLDQREVFEEFSKATKKAIENAIENGQMECEEQTCS
ncbi:transcriptional regulator GutM [Halanaerobacter jeridensis]|uniref:DNA-binding transcriptional regulator of glucitol operon n=1 Tax=Halanaerobacter jeridensis TaxID=706427 RepID=A0A938XSC1_9FIRM|nr:transcriptional regulator GutM [Halanaerobacter jeridensis]MBM7556904.1 DNA-binding transcriptional regulator of glucitol operon [Halanaerobacter jeridensis]